MSTSLILWVSSILGPYKSGGSNNSVFRCPFHEGGKHKGWSFVMHNTSGLCNCKSCGEGWSLRGFLLKMGMSSQYESLKEAGMLDTSLSKHVKLTRKTEYLPNDILYLFKPATLDLLPFPEWVLRHMDVRYDQERRRIVYPLREKRGKLVALHYRALDGDVRYMFYSKDEFEDMGILHNKSGKGGCFLNEQNVLKRLASGEWRNVILVEGPKQAMRVIEAGYPNVLATMGSMGNDQINTLVRYDAEILIFTDNDEPGRAAAYSYRRKLKYRATKARIVSYLEREERQPDEMSAETIKQLLEGLHEHTG